MINAGGKEKALFALKELLDQPAIERIGLVIDANDVGPKNRWATIKTILDAYFEESTLQNAAPNPSGIVLEAASLPLVGIWIMPDNTSNGYLEHFLAETIPSGDKLWDYSEGVLTDLKNKSLQQFSLPKAQKARLYTWLAWQKSPGLPFGTAAQSGYFDANAPVVNHFAEWFGRVFV